MTIGQLRALRLVILKILNAEIKHELIKKKIKIKNMKNKNKNGPISKFVLVRICVIDVTPA